VVRRYDETIDVKQTGGAGETGDGGGGGAATTTATAPESFLWQGRLYVVRTVLDHWQERRAWWRDAREGGDVLTDARERQVWRVEASAGRLGRVGVFDLGFDRGDAPGWQLLRVAD
jgi:hypothetical protein